MSIKNVSKILFSYHQEMRNSNAIINYRIPIETVDIAILLHFKNIYYK